MIDIDCMMNLVIVERDGELVVVDATILSDPDIREVVPGVEGDISRLIAEAKLNTVRVDSLSDTGYFKIETDPDSFSEWVKRHVKTIREGIE